jgi:hypothetical protein
VTSEVRSASMLIAPLENGNIYLLAGALVVPEDESLT